MIKRLEPVLIQYTETRLGTASGHSLTVFLCLLAGLAWAVHAADADEHLQVLRDSCAGCHGRADPEAGFSVTGLSTSVAGADLEGWQKIREMVSLGDMPPPDAGPIAVEQKKQLLKWLDSELTAAGYELPDLSLPQNGNRVDHDALFSGEHIGPAYTSSRLWRISPEIYLRFAATIDMARKLNAPLTSTGDHGFRDYSYLYADQAAIRTLMQNCKRAAATLVYGRVARVKNKSGSARRNPGGRENSRHPLFRSFAVGQGPLGESELNAVIAHAFEFLLERPPTKLELARYRDEFLTPNLELAGRDAALTGFLTTMMMSPEFLFRMEVGLGRVLPDGRRWLSPREVAYAVSYTLFDYLDAQILKAAEEGKLATRADVEREFRRMLTSSDRRVRAPAGKNFWPTGKGAGITSPRLMETGHPRLLRFFRQYFGYVAAPDVFKDDSRHDGKLNAWDLVRDADWFVLRALKDDRNVLKVLLTSDRYFVNSRANRKPIRENRVYNLDGPVERPDQGGLSQVPIAMPEGQRAGMLTHPAWLVAHSGNFETDPVRRGRWIREKLLAGIVPDIPIGVAAQLPDEPKQTLRQRFAIVNRSECWRCHRKMNPLGNPLEAYDDFGRYRTDHLVTQDDHVIASEFEAYSRLRKVTWRDSHSRGHPEEEFRSRPVDVSGEITGSGDAELDGKVDGPVQMMHRLAASPRVRQCFVRHVFRFWMGRNETLTDSPTLIAMDSAYVKSGGSFQELMVALVTSDSFLLRK